MALRWFGPGDPVTLDNIRQVPGVESVVSAVYDVEVGTAWPRKNVAALKREIESNGLQLAVIESIPVHEDIKLGRATREALTSNYCESIRVLGELEIPVLCYNFMPVFDWTRTDLAMRLDDGSYALAYDHDVLEQIDLSRGTGDLPGWATAYSAAELNDLLAAYRAIDEEDLWQNLQWFLERVVPVAEKANVKLAVHPDDPPWPIFELPRILTDAAAFERLIGLVDSELNGVTFCTGSLGASADNDLPAMIDMIGERIHFAHCRNVKRSGAQSFNEVAHPSRFGDVNMLEVIRALKAANFNGCMRPDHGRMIWDEQGRPGYGLYDRALGATYLQGLWEATTETNA
ncbi:MAG TPA: mannonate dehydratase [Longimicrobiales bacterium]|nr:mannonate dehydratase [Longimicrobiales bacterium]